MKLLIIDNNDSFTYNLVQMVEELGCIDFEVIVHDQVDIEKVAKYNKILISPGPSLPRDYPILNKIFKTYGHEKSILGICLGMQALNEFYGGQLYNLQNVVHGQEHKVEILKMDSLYSNIPQQIPVGLYHSWAVSEIDLPDCLEVTSRSKSGIIMSLRHKHFDIKGLQYHPESIITTHGFQIMKNWLNS
jgi:anthranilate synthase component II